MVGDIADFDAIFNLRYVYERFNFISILVLFLIIKLVLHTLRILVFSTGWTLQMQLWTMITSVIVNNIGLPFDPISRLQLSQITIMSWLSWQTMNQWSGWLFIWMSHMRLFELVTIKLKNRQVKAKIARGRAATQQESQSCARLDFSEISQDLIKCDSCLSEDQHSKNIIVQLMTKMYILALLVAVVLSANQSTFCWKDSYGRGVGIVPNACPQGQELLGLLCYKKCPVGFNRPAGLDCYSTCPTGFTDTGLYCMISDATYGRGAGYPWKFGDWLDDSGMFSRCQADYGQGNCEKYGLIVYPKCRAGYSNSGCCICAASFNCNSFGFWSNIQTAYSCFKNRVAVGGSSSPSCPSGYEDQAGLCYKKCNTGYYGVGPVCWANIPSGWVDCGMGAATTTLTCASTIFSQVSSVFMLAANIATFGTTGEATAGLKASDPKYIQKIKDLLSKVKDVYNKNQDVVTYFKGLAAAGSGAITAKNFISLMGMDNAQPEDIVRIIAEVISLFDPTGVSSVVAAYTYPMCSKMK